ncbi:MAG: hypothetical protein R3F39_05140 [Myxococcota bacterium]
MNDSLRRPALRAHALTVALVSSLMVAACGGITVPGDGETTCKSDDDCQSSKFCRVGSCDTGTGQCTFTVTSGSCFVGGECFQTGQEKPGDRCSICTPSLITTDFVARSCPDGQSCGASTGQCMVTGTDIVADTVADVPVDAVTDATVDVKPDSGPDVVPDTTVDSETDGGTPDCTNNEDCTALLEPSGCETAICIVASGECLLVELPEGSACSPESGTANPCVKGLCDAEGVCAVQQLSNTACDDGKPCTLGDLCVDGACVGTPVVCDDGKACTIDVCDPANGQCSSQPYPDAATVPCDDGNACTSNDVCVAGSCKGGANACACVSDEDCVDDGNLCNGTPVCVEVEGGTKACEIDPATVVSCDTSGDSKCEKTSCVPATGACESAVLANAACDDGDACTFADKCGSTGVCAGSPQVCNDDKVCTSDACVGGQCKFTALTGTACNPGTISDPACFVGQCAASGECAAVPQTGIGCNDSNACTQNDKCQAGVCVGTAKVCNDSNPCTNDSCNASGVCVFTPVTAATACDDGDACTKDDACSAGVCKGGNSICQCTTDANCTDDGNLCNGVPKCKTNTDGSKACVVDPATIVTCSTTSDGPCEDTKCTPATGQCAKVPKPSTAVCDDGDACTTGDHCSGTGTCTKGTSKTCNDSVDCTTDTCAPATGNCVFTPDSKGCDDGNACTMDSCTATGCVNVQAGEFTQCDDGNSKTVSDFCFQSTCIGALTAAPSMSKCTSGNAVGLGVDGLGFYLGFSGTCDITVQQSILASIGKDGGLTTLGTAALASSSMDGLAIFGPGPDVGVVNTTSQTATWGTEFESALAAVATNAFVPSVAVATGPVYLVAGWDGKAKGGRAFVCSESGTIPKGSMVCNFIQSDVPFSALNPVAAAARLTIPKVGKGTYAYTLVSFLDGKVQVLIHSLFSSGVAVDPGSAKEVYQELLGSGEGAPRGVVYHDGAAMVFGDSEYLLRCDGTDCGRSDGFASTGVSVVDAWNYSAGTVFLAVATEKSTLPSLFFLAKGLTGAKPEEFVRVDLPSNGTSSARFIEGGTTTGIYVLGVTSKGSTSLPTWVMQLP